MKPVKQTRVHPKQGNCAAACLASLFELPIEEVFDGESEAGYKNDGEFWDGLRNWMLARGIMWAHVSHAPFGYSIAVGPSPRLKRFDGKPEPHACIALNGDLIHDPHPDNTFFGEHRPWEYWVIYSLDPSKLQPKVD